VADSGSRTRLILTTPDMQIDGTSAESMQIPSGKARARRFCGLAATEGRKGGLVVLVVVVVVMVAALVRAGGG
jgi:hypothetical protein